MTTSVFEKKSKQDLIDYLNHASKYIQMDTSRVYDVTLNQIKFFKNQNIPYEDLREMKVLEARWYKALETGKPDYSVYASPFYFVDIWVCWVTYSRKYLQMIQSPKSMTGKSIVQDMGNVRTVIDLGCGFGYTCAAWKSIYPSAQVIGTNLAETPQYKMCVDLSSQYGFSVTDTYDNISADVVFASEYFEHIIDPIAHLTDIIRKCNPKYFLIASTFNSPSIGHFNEYEYKGKLYSGTRMSRMFNDALRHYGYEKVKTNCWNNRPAYWKKKR
jgi:2-polyprenyl-3-methyl-5-hydroxy-6-metoxy-1,4-benzoquinol methylase